MESIYMRAFLLIEAAMSALCFLVFALDKLFAVRRRRRIRESVLLLFLWLCGAPGGLFSMAIFRHKTKHPVFWVNGLVALVLQIAFAWGVQSWIEVGSPLPSLCILHSI